MKKLLFILTACCLSLTAFAADHYVSQATGDDNNSGDSWQAAKATITAALNAAAKGDNIYIAAGTYNEGHALAPKADISIRGGYDAATGQRDIDAFQTIIDGTGTSERLLTTVAATSPTYIEGITFQNASCTVEGAGIYVKDNVIVQNCIVRNCSGSMGGGIYISAGSAEKTAIVRNSIVELCDATGEGGGICCSAYGLVDACIIRGCEGQYGGAITFGSSKSNVLRNSVIHNNSALSGNWPNSGGMYARKDNNIINCTFANNYGDGYGGIHSESHVINSVFWGNRPEDGFAEAANFISGDTQSSNNYADQGFDSESFASVSMPVSNNAAGGPHFRYPTTFIGLPKNQGELAVMRAADFSIAEGSVLIDKGKADGAPDTDINGLARPIGSKVDVGAYEYDPDAVFPPVTGIHITIDTLFIVEEEINGLAAIIEPSNAGNKAMSWSIDNPEIATIDANGTVIGVLEGITVARVISAEGSFKDTAVVVVAPKPPVHYPHEVLEADELYLIENYTVPSYIPFWVAKEAARIDSLTCDDVTTIAPLIEKMNQTIQDLQPKEEPYNMVANINGDPRTRMAFCWFTNEGIEQGEVQLLALENATSADFEAGTGVITIDATPTTTKPLAYAVSTSGLLKATGMDKKTKFTYVSHKAIAENLTPGTAYSWRVGYDGHWSDIARFRTKDDSQEEYSFIYMTDSHIMNAEYVEEARWCAEAVARNEPDVRFCVFPGDFVETGTTSNSEWEWERWFEESLRPVIMRMPIVPTDGNHDDSGNRNYTYHFNTDNQFNKRASVKPQFEGITYSFVYGDVLFLVYSKQDYWRGAYNLTKMTSAYLTNDVGTWFREQVSEHPNTKYRVALVHKNIFSGSEHSTDPETPMFRATMLPIMKDCEIDLVLQGHDHCYEVIGPVDPDTKTPILSAISDRERYTKSTSNFKGGTFCTDDGTLYFIGATCGKKRYGPHSKSQMNKDIEKHKVENYYDLFTGLFLQPGAPSYTKITVTPDALVFNSYKVDKQYNSTLFNTMRVVRNKVHGMPKGIEAMPEVSDLRNGEKVVIGTQVCIRRGEHIYNALGQELK